MRVNHTTPNVPYPVALVVLLAPLAYGVYQAATNWPWGLVGLFSIVGVYASVYVAIQIMGNL